MSINGLAEGNYIQHQIPHPVIIVMNLALQTSLEEAFHMGNYSKNSAAVLKKKHHKQLCIISQPGLIFSTIHSVSILCNAQNSGTDTPSVTD